MAAPVVLVVAMMGSQAATNYSEALSSTPTTPSLCHALYWQSLETVLNTPPLPSASGPPTLTLLLSSRMISTSQSTILAHFSLAYQSLYFVRCLLTWGGSVLHIELLQGTPRESSNHNGDDREFSQMGLYEGGGNGDSDVIGGIALDESEFVKGGIARKRQSFLCRPLKMLLTQDTDVTNLEEYEEEEATERAKWHCVGQSRRWHVAALTRLARWETFVAATVATECSKVARAKYCSERCRARAPVGARDERLHVVEGRSGRGGEGNVSVASWGTVGGAREVEQAGRQAHRGMPLFLCAEERRAFAKLSGTLWLFGQETVSAARAFVGFTR
ncbi:hypothetical protein L7F22_022176 [Adiantum nelumboides]|nr:hypothetical protein [Adiantum nelumboides]